MKTHTIVICFFLMLTTALPSCKKEKKPEPASPVPSGCDTTFNASYNPDTILPSPYLMTYPGSVWNYDDGTAESCTAWEQVGIEETTTAGNCVTVHKTYTIVPKTTFGYIYGENYLYLKPNHKTTEYIPFLTMQPGVFYTHYSTQNDAAYSVIKDTLSVAEILDSMEVLGNMYYDVIHVHKYHSQYYPFIGSGPVSTTEFYYANQVGLIRKDLYWNSTVPVITNLVSYTIGPH